MVGGIGGVEIEMVGGVEVGGCAFFGQKVWWVFSSHIEDFWFVEGKFNHRLL